MTLLEELATLAAQLDLGTYSAAVGGSIFLKRLPDQPDTAIAIARYAGPESPAGLGLDEPRFQFRVRGPANDLRVAEAKAQDVYDKLHGLRDRALPGGTWLVHMIGVQSGPIDLGEDEHGRPEYVVNMRTAIERVTPNRGD